MKLILWICLLRLRFSDKLSKWHDPRSMINVADKKPGIQVYCVSKWYCDRQQDAEARRPVNCRLGLTIK